jgi:tetratricopeptide (TPR) repeat protein
MYYTGMGGWSTAREAFVGAQEIAERIKDRVRFQDAARFLGWIVFMQGDWPRAQQIHTDLYAMAARGQDALYRAYALSNQGEIYARQGDFAQATEALEAARGLMSAKAGINNIQIWTLGLLALVHWKRDQAAAADEAAAAALALLRATPVAAFYALGGYVALCEVLLAQAAQSPRGAGGRELAEALTALRGFARRYPVARAAMLRCTGRAHWQAGRRQKAINAWSRGLEAAVWMNLPYEVGLAYLELGKAGQSAARLQNLRDARDIFGQIGALDDLATARAELVAAQTASR